MPSLSSIGLFVSSIRRALTSGVQLSKGLGHLLRAVLLVGALLAVAIVSGRQAQAADARYISIGTGGVTGVYYPAGSVICRLLNTSRAEHGIRCSVESTKGSIFNLEQLRAGKLEFGIVQSDWQHHAYEGSADFAGKGSFETLRSVLSLHSELVTFVARADSGIATLEDFKGKRFNIGNPGSGARGTWDEIQAALGWGDDVFAEVSELKSSEVAQALCDGEIDGYVWPVGHPSKLIRETLAACPSVLIPAEGKALDTLVSERGYFEKGVIPAETYGLAQDVPTFGMMATLVTTSDVPEEIVYTLTEKTFENLDALAKRDAALAKLEADHMWHDGLVAPLHEGAQRYYREQGWLK